MSDRFSILSLRSLLKITLHGIDNNNSFLSIPGELFFNPNKNKSLNLKIFGKSLETPIGVAAGPHTQLAQNIVAAWLTGARFIELKTVQTLDELNVSKPCIDMQDEGYNCEWSQELKIKQSFDQYLNAWIIIHILKDKFEWKNDNPGTIFNMSIGYDFKGILQNNVQWFLDKMADASDEITQKIEEIKDIYPNVINLKINPQISNNITLSTMHGCPPDEIEQIGEYLIAERKLHTAIKLNPTLLGKEKLKEIINNSGFDTLVPDIAFEHDLKYRDAINIINRLKKKAVENNVQFSLKLTNTLESVNNKHVFSPDEKMMYASGRVLHPISINLAKKLQNEFNGQLSISFSGGANAINISDIISSGLFPVTVCSDILKPGGYGKLKQYIENLPDLSTKLTPETKVKSWEYLRQYADEVLLNKLYKKTNIKDPSIKTGRQLEYFDCINAPCVDNCPTNQDIPAYMYHTANGDFDKAYEVILKTNPFPNTTGMVCDHPCQTKCTRINYDNPLLIREIKRFVTKKAINKISAGNYKKFYNNLKVAIIGAGPAGLSSARYLREAGFEVEIFEQKNKAGGMVLNAIPSFRLTNESILEDIKEIEKTGVKINYGKKVNYQFFNKIQKEFDYTIIAAGAQKARMYNIAGQDAKGVFDPLDFLFKVKNNQKINLGKDVLIVGGGNTAMDAARTAIRLVENEGNVNIVYRRTINQMPADVDEIIAAKKEGVRIIELAAPIKINEKEAKVVSLRCIKIKLGNPDESGRRIPIPIPDSEFDIKADSIIMAIGQDIDIDFIDKNLLRKKKNSYEIKIPNVFIGGDALRGGSTVINAVADGRKIAKEIISKSKLKLSETPDNYNKKVTIRELLLKKSNTVYSKIDFHTAKPPLDFNLTTKTLSEKEAINEASRCLYCDEICNICTTVCPNLALFPYTIDSISFPLEKITIKNNKIEIIKDSVFEVRQNHQILLISDWCNECGNCNTFCPTSGAPYKEKPHLFLDKNAFMEAEKGFYYDLNRNNTILYKIDKKLYNLTRHESYYEYNFDKITIKLNLENLKVISFDIPKSDFNEIKLKNAALMKLILIGAQQI